MTSITLTKDLTVFPSASLQFNNGRGKRVLKAGTVVDITVTNGTMWPVRVDGVTYHAVKRFAMEATS